MSNTPITKKLKDLSVLNEDLENYFANTIIPQLFVDGDLILRKFTPPAMKHFSLTNKDIDRDIHDVKDNIRYPTLIDNIEEVIITGKILEKEIQTLDGKWFQMNILPYFEHKEKRMNGVIITFVDISKRITAMRELEKLNAQHETLIDTLTHDLRQPLTAIILLTDVLKDSYDNQDRSEFIDLLNKLKHTSKDMDSLMESFSHEIKNESIDTPERVNIENICNDVVLSLKDVFYKDGIIIKSEFNTSEINFSRNNLRSIVYNLFNNAIKFKRAEEPLVINIKTEKIDDYILLTIEDNGIGISKENISKIFQKATRLNENIEGTGMGLYIIKRMLENKEGKIEVESKLGKGSIFKIYFKSGYKGEKKD